MSKNLLPYATFSRLRMTTDGQGVTSLVASFGCPLRCRLCINAYAQSIPENCNRISCEELYEMTKIDHLYFLATGGGLTFGGGESLLYADFIAEFAQLYPNGWKLNVETALQVERRNIETVIPVVHTYIIDIKTLDPYIYKTYTGGDITRMLDNLDFLRSQVDIQRMHIRVPLIPELKTKEMQAKEAEQLRQMGFTNIDCFTYVNPDEYHKKQKKQR